MGDISRNISRKELACKCGCGFCACDKELIDIVQECIDYFVIVEEEAIEVIFNSGCRCVEHNEVVQKESNSNYIPYSSKSEHTHGIAVDFWLRSILTKKPILAARVYDYLDKKYPHKYGIGKYRGRTHLDVKPGSPRRW